MNRRMMWLFSLLIVLVLLPPAARLIFPAESAPPQRKQADVSTLPASNPQEFDLLDSTGQWAQFGTVDPVSHAFTPTGASTGGGGTLGPNAVAGSVTATTGPLSVTLAAASGKTTAICGFTITSGGTSPPLVVTATITGTIAILNYSYVFVSSGQGVFGTAYPACIPASAANTPIVINVPGGGTGTTASLVAWGLQQ